MPDSPGWTVETILAHLTALMDESERRHDDRFTALDRSIVVAFEAQQTGILAAMNAQEKLVNAALAASKEAVAKAEEAANKRFEGVNEFRGTLSDQQRTLMPRSESEVKYAALERSLLEITSRLDRQEGRGNGMGQLWGWIVGAVGVALALASFFLRH